MLRPGSSCPLGLLLLIGVSLWPSGAWAHPNHQLDLVYTHPGGSWVEDGLPLGNGAFGALVLGGISEDRLQLNDPTSRDADGRSWPLGELVLRTGHEAENARTYLRRLDLQTASVEISYRDGRIRHRREYFASVPDRVLVGKWRAIRKGAIEGTLSWQPIEGAPSRAWQARFEEEDQRWVIWDPSAKDEPRGIEIGFRLRGGELKMVDGEVRIDGADELIVLVSLLEAPSRLEALRHDDAVAIYQRHLPEYQDRFHAMYLTLEGGAKTQLATQRRRQDYLARPEEDPSFEELLFQYGRYLLWSSSGAQGLQGAGIQPRGIWWFPPEAGWLDNRRLDPGSTLWELMLAGAAPSQLFAEEALGDSAGFKWPSLEPFESGANSLAAGMGRFLAASRAGKGDVAYSELRELLQQGLQDNLLFAQQNIALNAALVRGMTDLFARETPEGVLHWGESLPGAWPDGSVVGLRTPHLEVAYVWQERSFLEGYLTRLQDGEVRIASARPLRLDQPGRDHELMLAPDESGVVRYAAKGGETWRLRALDDSSGDSATP